ncbi:c-type cytochrome [Edaphobacter albus]|uniref:c-type cytochrome n=1 Tax=Edaphobacter sp. 4G125 TaxID=2763071 RepID=UPI001644EF45|nr:c-type cytochrome [Edaphobacter sp. 4G125]QNI36736.1 c-type cytochrome [Edaphobacter sp. 4G125]
MTRTRAILLSATGLLCFFALPVALHLRPVLAGAQEPEYHSQQSLQQAPSPARQSGRRMDSHTALGLGRLPNAEAAKRGEPLYNQNCAACHGEGARGGIGPNLVRSVLVLHDDDDSEIARVIRGGRPQAGMPPFKQLTDPQVRDIAEYLHQLVELAANRGLYKSAETMTSGNIDKGKAFFAANCASCHSVTSDLAGIGAKYSQPSALIVRIAWPASRGPVTVTVTTPEGHKFTGTLEHYDDFETTLKTSGKTFTWATDSVHVEMPDKLAGHRALLPKYSDDDLHDLTRYLLTIK